MVERPRLSAGQAVLLVVDEASPEAEDVSRALAAQTGALAAVGARRGGAVVTAARRLLARGVRRLAVLPLELAGSPALPADLKALRWNTPGLLFHSLPPLGASSPLVAAFAERAAAVANGALAEASLLVVAPDGGTPEARAEIARLARLLWERAGARAADYAFLGGATPTLAAGVARAAREGATVLIVVPALIGGGAALATLDGELAAAEERSGALRIVRAGPLGGHPGVVAAIVEAVAAASERSTQEPRRPHSHGGIEHSHPIEAILPPRYRGGVAVSAAPMGAAELVYNDDGTVAWDAVWSGFCELALAGGPPHRGTLLEPVTPAEVEADPVGYQRVLTELTRGISLTTGLPVTLSSTPGWIGVRCHSEEMAIWLLRAIVVENVFARREGTVLYLPAGPAFRLEREVKNVITVLAKTHHYWQEHRAALDGP
jgi:sirohydrochlorin cobaltochelatase